MLDEVMKLQNFKTCFTFHQHLVNG